MQIVSLEDGGQFAWNVYAYFHFLGKIRKKYFKMLSDKIFTHMLSINVIFEGWAQDCSNSNIFLKPLFRGNFDSFVNNANLGAIARTSNGI